MRLVILFCILFASLSTAQSPPETGGFWVINDFHVNLSYNSDVRPYGDVNYDPPLLLFTEAVKFCSMKDANPNFVLLLGDFALHMRPDTANGSEVLLRTMRTIVQKFREYFPATPVYPVIGNHDQFPTRLIHNNSYYDELIEKGNWKQLFNNSNLTEKFKKGGYYSADISDFIRLIVLNSIVFMSDFEGERNHAQLEQIDWLSTQLEDAVKEKKTVFLASHIPFGLGNDFFGDPNTFLDETYNQKLYSVISDKPVKIVNFWGHQHTDQFKVADELVALISPAVSPLHGGSNPSVRFCTYDKYGLVDYDQYTMDLNSANKGNISWNHTYSFRSAYQTDFSKTDMLDLAKRIFSQPRLGAEYVSRIFAFIRQATAPRKFICLVSSLWQSQYTECLGAKTQFSNFYVEDGDRGRFIVIATSVCCVIFAFMAVLFVRVFRKGDEIVREKKRWNKV